MMAFPLQILWTVVAAAVVLAASKLLQGYKTKYWMKTKWAQKQRDSELHGWPLVGVVPELLKNFTRMHDYITSHLEKHSTITLPMTGSEEHYFTADVENVRYILKTNFDNFVKGGSFHDKFEVLLGDGVFNADGENWKLQRKTVMPEFTSRNLRDFYAATHTEMALRVSCLLDEVARTGASVDMQDVFLRMTLASIGKTGFGVDIGCLPWQLPLPVNAFATAFDSASEAVCWRFFDPTWKVKRFLKVGLEAKLPQHLDVIDSFVYGVIAQRKLEMDAAKEQEAKGLPAKEQKLDIITRFLKLSEDENSSVDCKLIRDICLNFVIAGRDSSAVTLSWLVHSLMQNPKITMKLQEELVSFETKYRNLMASDDSRDAAHSTQADSKIQDFANLLTYANLHNSLKNELPYLTACISETLRLYPAVPEIPKVVKENAVFPDGTHIRKGMICSYSPYAMGRMTKIWGPDARVFNPERWFHDGKFVMESEFKLTAFQAGSRMCMGRDSAYTQMKITAAILYRFFEFKLVEGHCVEYKVMIILPLAHGLKVNVKRREDPTLL